MSALEISADRKTSPSVRVRVGKQDAYPNAFGLPAGPAGSCRDVTPFCNGCYAARTEQQWSTVARKMSRNFSSLLELGDNYPAIVDAIDLMVAQWQQQTQARGLPLTFRIHWDGDFYSAPYARAWATIARAYPAVTFWCYTRAVWAIALLEGIDNLAVYASVDQYNRERWAPILEQYPAIRVASCAQTFEQAQTILLELGRKRAPSCPEGHKLPLVVGATGRPSDVPAVGETGQGACNACGYCLTGKGDIRFSTTKG